jgi:alkylhydroperoxidase family enzyme
MVRVPGIDPNDADPAVRALFESQTAIWGAPLAPYLVYARRPGVCLAVRGMWDALDASGLIEAPLKALVCRRVASLIGCPF